MKLKQANGLRKVLRRFRSVRTIVNLPSMLRGLRSANAWREYSLPGNGVLDRPDLHDSSGVNPLKEYFESVRDGRGIWKWGHYFDIYHRHLQKFVGKEVKIVEVGIFSGGSLTMWKKYFGLQSSVYGVDLEPNCRAYEDERTKVFIGDQGDRGFWQRFREEVKDIDIVIDDGGHLPEQQVVTLEETVPYLRPGGVYLCEDIIGSQNRFAAYVHGLTTALNSFALTDVSKCDGIDGVVAASPLQRSICSVHLYPFVAVVEKSAHPVDQFLSLKRGTQWQPWSD